MRFCEWLGCPGRKLEVMYCRIHRHLGELSHSSWSVLFLPYSSITWKPLMNTILGQLWNNFAVLYAWCFVPGTFPSLLSQWHYSSDTGCCVADHWKRFRRTGEKSSHFGFPKRAQEERTAVSSISPNLAPIKENTKFTFMLGHWDVRCRKGRKGPGWIQRGLSFPTDLLWAEGYVAERCSVFTLKLSTLYMKWHNVIFTCLVLILFWFCFWFFFFFVCFGFFFFLFACFFFSCWCLFGIIAAYCGFNEKFR